MSLFFNNDLVHCVYFCVNPFQDKTSVYFISTNLLHLWCSLSSSELNDITKGSSL